MDIIFFGVVFGVFAVMLLMKINTNLEYSSCEDSDSRDD